MRRRYVQDPKTGKLVPAELYRRSSDLHHVQGDIEPFRSHVDGTMITSSRDLREHNARNNVVQADGGDPQKAWERQDFYAGKPYDQERRRDAIKFAYELHKEGRSKADIRQMSENYQKLNR